MAATLKPLNDDLVHILDAHALLLHAAKAFQPPSQLTTAKVESAQEHPDRRPCENGQGQSQTPARHEEQRQVPPSMRKRALHSLSGS